MKKSMNLDMTEGKPLKLILLFSVPILFGNIFQQFYNVMDTAIVGNVLGDDALAAVGATSPLFSLIINSIAYGLTNGFSMVLARFYGGKEEDKFKKTLYLSYVLSMVIAVALTVIALAATKPLLRLLGTPESIIGDSVIYLNIAFGGLVITMAYNVLAGVMRAIGNSVMPLVFLIIASVVNVALDFLFVAVLHMGVGGAAVATVIAQLVSVMASLWYVLAKCPELKIEKKDRVVEYSIVKDLLSTGLSVAMMFAVVSLGTVILQSAINSFDKEIIAAHTAARKILELFMIPLSTFAVTASTYASQNYGAGRIDRVKEGIFDIFLLGFAWSTVGVLAAFTVGPFLTAAITGSENTVIIDTAVKYIRINFPFFYFLVPLLVLRSTLQGLNRKVVPIIGSGIELVGKFVIVAFFAPKLGYFGVCISEPIIWVICMALVMWDFCVHILKGDVVQNEKR
ncbi:MAG: MATE family efflux transporter [Bacteroidales bacterium]|nr:MATE family efflux transporter [Clostridium sp.]MCM1204498.1 MATE family efflux transporter [Bacteroidales bacterium]